MRSLLNSDAALLLKSGFLHVPLVHDQAVEREVESGAAREHLVEAGGTRFVKTLSVQSLLDNYDKVDPEEFREFESELLKDISSIRSAGGLSIEGRLRTILFEVMPRFVRRRGGFQRRRLGEEEIPDRIAEGIRVPARYFEEAARLEENADSVRRAIRRLEEPGRRIEPPEEGLIRGSELREWIRRAVTARVAERERSRLERMLAHGAGLDGTPRGRIALRLYLAGAGSMEIDGFGFVRRGAADDYFVYKRTGAYALKDFYGRLYLFPDCRVAVSTDPPLRPFVFEVYKHPFLEDCDSGQPICLRDFDPPSAFSAEGAVRALEEGLNALLRGYSSRRRNGYHSLEKMPRFAGTAEPDDGEDPWLQDYPVFRRRRVSYIDFDDYRIPNDHPGVVSGEVEITNDLTP
jgi:hypothetical protein